MPHQLARRPRFATRSLFSLAAVAAMALLAAAPATAQESSAEQVQMSLERYGQLLRVADRVDGPRATWARGSARVNLPGDAARPAQVTVETRVTLVGDGVGEVPILPAVAVVTSATANGSDLTLVQRGGAHVALLEGARTVTLRLTYLVSRELGDDGSPVAVVPLPPMPGAALTVDGAGPAGAVFPGVDVSRSGNQLTASLPATPAVVIRSAQAGGGHTVRKAGFTLRPDDDGDGVDVEAVLEATLDGNRADIRLARSDSALIDAREGNRPLTTRVVDGWHTARVEGRGSHTIRARFRLAVDRTQGQPQVRIHPDEVPIAEVALDVAGKAEVTLDPPLPVDTTIRGDGDDARTIARAFLPPTDEAVLRWTEARAAPETKVRVNAETYQLLTLEEGVLRSRVLARYDVIYGKLRELPIVLPDGVVPYKVIGEGIEDWQVRTATDDQPRHVRVILGDELEGKLSLELQIEVPVSPREGTALTLPLVQPLETEQVVIRQQGVIALFDGDKVGFAPAQANAFSKVGQDALPVDIRQTLRDTVNQAFKHLGAPQSITSAVAAAKARETRFDATVDTLYLVQEQSVTARSWALIEIKSGRLDVVHVSLPTGSSADEIPEPRITGPKINKVSKAEGFDAGDGRQTWQVSFTEALEGAILLDIEFEQLLGKELGPMNLPDLLVHGATVQKGHFGIAADAGMEVQEKTRKDVRPARFEDLPNSVRMRDDKEIRLAYSYGRAPWALEADVRAHAMVETLDAEARQVRYETNVLESGYVVGRATFVVTNEDRQYLRVTLPEGATPLQVVIDGRRIDEVRDDAGKIAIPLPKDATTRIDLTYELRREALGVFDRFELAAPAADLRTKDIQWLLRITGSRTAVGVDSDMKPVPHYAWQPPEGGASEALPLDDGSHMLAFVQPVHSADDGPLLISMSLVHAPDESAGPLLILIGLVCLVLFVRRRAGGAPPSTGSRVLLVIGVLALVLKAALWSFEPEEAGLIVVAVVVMAFFARRGRKAREAAAAQGLDGDAEGAEDDA